MAMATEEQGERREQLRRMAQQVARSPEFIARLEESHRRAEAFIRYLEEARKVTPDMLQQVMTI